MGGPLDWERSHCSLIFANPHEYLVDSQIVVSPIFHSQIFDSPIFDSPIFYSPMFAHPIVSVFGL